MEHFQLPPNSHPDLEKIARVLEESIQAFCSISQVPVTFFDINGLPLWESGEPGKICSYFDLYRDPASVCGRNLISSVRQASLLSEPYVFVCKAGLVKIAVSLLLDGKPVGCFMAGPLIMGGLKESVINNMFSLSKVPMDAYPKIILFLRNMKAFKAREVSHLASLLYNSILAPITPNENYSGIQRQHLEQRKIGESLQKYKREHRPMPYPYELENQLIHQVSLGHGEDGQRALKRLLDELSILEAGDLWAIKTKVLSIFALLTRSVGEGTTLPQEDSETFFFEMSRVNEATTFQELERLASRLLMTISQTMEQSTNPYHGSSQIIHQAIKSIRINSGPGVSLSKVAEELHTNPAYLSMLFRQEMGQPFTDYLNQTRIEKSCRLLVASSASLAEIANQSGFEDQSYFSKVFRKWKRMTPKDYRKSQIER